MFNLDQTLPTSQQAYSIVLQMQKDTLPIVSLQPFSIGVLIQVLSRQVLQEQDQEHLKIYKKYVQSLSQLKKRKEAQKEWSMDTQIETNKQNQNQLNKWLPVQEKKVLISAEILDNTQIVRDIFQQNGKNQQLTISQKPKQSSSGHKVTQIENMIKNSNLIKPGGLFYEKQDWSLEDKAIHIVRSAWKEMLRIVQMPPSQIDILIQILAQHIDQEPQQDRRKQFSNVYQVLIQLKEEIKLRSFHLKQSADSNIKNIKKQQPSKTLSNLTAEQKPASKRSFFSKAFDSSRKAISKVKNIFGQQKTQSNQHSQILLLSSKDKNEID